MVELQLSSANQAAGYGASDRNGRCGHSRSLVRWRANHSRDANRLNAPTKPLREVLADYSYRDHHASVQKVARNGGASITVTLTPTLS
jgi:hypothetical protein